MAQILNLQAREHRAELVVAELIEAKSLDRARNAIRGLMQLKFADTPVPIEEVEPAAEIVKRAKTVVWNGPMGVFEIAETAKGTLADRKSVV